MTSPTENETQAAGQWFRPPTAERDAALQLFLLPHAGGGAEMYRDWLPLLPADVAPRALTSPGRERRRAERPFTDWDSLYAAVHDAVAGQLDGRPFAIFGHCLGARLGLRLASRFAAEGLPAPALLGVSGWSPRGFNRTTLADSRLPSDELITQIRGLGSLPADVRPDTELPALRADLRAAATFTDDGASLTCPLVSYGGAADPLMEEPDAMDHWATRSTRYLGHKWLPGGHFFPQEHAAELATHFLRTLHGVRTGPALSLSTT